MSDEHFLYEWRTGFMSDKGLDSNARHILHVLFSHMNRKDASCFPSITRISGLTGLSRPTVLKYLKVAVKRGWLRKEQRKSSLNSYRQNVYHAVIPANIKGVGNEVDQVVKLEGGVGNEVNQGGKAGTEKVGNSFYSNKQNNKEDNNQDENTGPNPLGDLSGFSKGNEKPTPMQHLANMRMRVQKHKH